jgi:hypothetical protein
LPSGNRTNNAFPRNGRALIQVGSSSDTVRRQSVIELDLMVMNPQADAADFLPVAGPLPAEKRALLRPGGTDLEESQNASV